MQKGSRLIRPGDVTVHFSPPIDPTQFSLESRKDLLARIESEVAAHLPPDQQPLA
jgi:1-acyl-sn-glycerol-3-phosphate acyltransferase